MPAALNHLSAQLRQFLLLGTEAQADTYCPDGKFGDYITLIYVKFYYPTGSIFLKRSDILLRKVTQ